MLLNPYEPDEEIEYDYAIIDLSINSHYYYAVKDKLISLAPEYAKSVQESFPYIVKLNNIDLILFKEIVDYDFNRVQNLKYPFFLFKFKSKPNRQPDIVNHLKNILIVGGENKKSLYRFYDPRVWFHLNYFKSRDFLFINNFFKFVEISFLKERWIFFNENDVFFSECDFKILNNIGIINRVNFLLDNYFDNLNFYFKNSKSILEYIEKINIENKDDIVCIIFHIKLLGDNFLNSDLFNKLKSSSEGYEKSSKELSKESWLLYFEDKKIVDDNLKNKVMYGY